MATTISELKANVQQEVKKIHSKLLNKVNTFVKDSDGHFENK